MNITMHVMTKHDGWQRQCTRPYQHPRWDDFDRAWIDEMLRDGSEVLTIGEIMYNVEHNKH